jgi:hypothetical protein
VYGALELTGFALLWVAIAYVTNSIIIGRPKKLEFNQTLAYIVAVATVGVFGEIFLDTIYNYFVGNPLWEYRILPVHNGYTSSYAVVTWGIYGFYLSMLHDTLSKYNWSILKLALLMSVEALFAEAALTVSAKLFLGEFLYYYFPDDLWHISSFQNIPFYFICAVIVTLTARYFKANPIFFALLCSVFVSVLLFMV